MTRPALVERLLASPGLRALAALVATVSSMADPVCLVLDHVELLTNQQCLDEAAELARRSGASRRSAC